MLKIEPYLARIGYQGSCAPTVELLQKLHRLHLTHVPYENLDLVLHRPCPLDAEAVYRKIVEAGRGGYCFELNGLFAALLRELGYRVTEYFGRWLLGEAPLPARRHRILRVEAEGRIFVADVGVGCVCPLEPLVFELDTVQMREGRPYRIVRDDRLGLVVQTDAGEGFVNFYSFTEDPQYPIDFEYVHYFCANSPDSVFNREIKVHLFAEEGRRSLMEEPYPATGERLRVLKLGTADGVERRVIPDAAALDDALRRYFGIVIPGLAAAKI